MRSPLAALTAVAALALVGCSSVTGDANATGPATAAGRAQAAVSTPYQVTSNDWYAYHRNRARTGNFPGMPAVRGAMSRVASLKLDGKVYASPIVVDGITIVATENDTVYGFDRSYRQLWKQHLGSPAPQSQLPCGNIFPLGITGTPVYANGLVYVAPEFGSPVRHFVYAMSLTTGRVSWHRSLDLPGVDAQAMQQRGGLTVVANRVWVPFGGLTGDCGAYKGRLIGYRLDGRTSSSVNYTVPTAREAGIWAPPGMTVDAEGRLLVAVGNGASGVGNRYDHSDSVLSIGTTGLLQDSFAPTTWASDNDADLDLGSQGPAAVGAFVFIAGKSGTAYTARRSHLGGIGGQVGKAAVCRSFGGTSVVGSTVYVPCADGVRAVSVDSAGRMRVLWHAAGAANGSPIVGGGRVWTLDAANGVLYALDPVTGRTRATISVGPVSRFGTPAISGADLIVPTLAGATVVGTS